MAAPSNETVSQTAGQGTGRLSPGRPAQDIWKALSWISLALVAFSLTAIAGRECGKHMTAMNMVFYRNAISLVLLLAWFQYAGIKLASLKSTQPGMQIGRALLHFCGQWCWMYALLLIPMIELVALEFTMPLWVAVMAPFLVGERLTAARITAAVLGFIGAMIIVRPGIATVSEGSLFAVACAIFFAFNLVGTRYLTRKDGPLTILMFMTVHHSILAAFFGWSTLQLPTMQMLPWVLMLGCASLAAHFGLAKALAYAEAIVVAPIDFLRLPLMALIGYLLYAEPLQGVVLLGTLVVIGGNIVNLWGERAQMKTQPAK